jgi:hypothetical protein
MMAAVRSAALETAKWELERFKHVAEGYLDAINKTATETADVILEKTRTRGRDYIEAD